MIHSGVDAIFGERLSRSDRSIAKMFLDEIRANVFEPTVNCVEQIVFLARFKIPDLNLLFEFIRKTIIIIENSFPVKRQHQKCFHESSCY